ncbi:MAG TPA: multidrug efflux RND transporter permease subunit [Vicinamibacterales bacterium]|nr:multidrug efflux RND transporter permease subunit [Vicinamibacterales bacterium]
MWVDTFIRRPVLSTVCSLIIVFGGLIAIPTLPIAQYPILAPPQVNVSSVYTGASAQTVESAVTVPLEQAINGVEGLSYLTSSSTSSGFSSISAVFDVTRNQDLAAVDIQNRVASASGRLPNEVKDVGVTVTKASTGFVMGAGVYDESGQYDALFLSNYLDVFVRDALKRVPGVADVIIFGERKYAMRLWLDPTRLAARGLTAGDVVNALREQNVQIAAGQVGQPPVPSGQMYQIGVRAAGRLTEVHEFEDIIVKAEPDGQLVRLRDVGRAELGAESYTSNLRYNGREAVGFGVSQLPSANALEVYANVKAEIERLSKNFPPGMKYQIAFDTASVVEESIGEVLQTLYEAIFLVVLVLFVFLQNWRSTIIPAFTIPVSLIGAFIFVKLLGFSINTLTLFGIVLATGIVVDDAIVVIENIQRHMHQFGTRGRRAASEAMREVYGAVIATSLVLVAVFVPVALFPGTTGILYQQFSLTIAFSVALSAFNALTLTPALSALLLREEGGRRGVFALFERMMKAGTDFYIKVLRVVINRRGLTIGVFAAGLVLTVIVYRMVPTAFVPAEDQNFIICQVQAPEGASLEYTARVAQQAERILLDTPEINGVFSVMGFSFGGSAPNRGLIFIRLKPYKERPGSEHSAMAVVGRLQQQFASINEAIVVPFLPPSIPGLGALGGFQFQLLDQSGGDINRLAQVARDLIAAANERPELRGIFTTFTAADPQLVVDIDRERVKALDMPLDEVSSALQVFLGSQYVNDFDFNNRSYRVYVQADQRFRNDPAQLGQFYARSRNGQMLPLDNLVRIRESSAPQVIPHFNLFRSVEINGSAAPGVSSGEALRAMEEVAEQTLPPGYSFEWAGQSREELKAGQQSIMLFALGLLLVYLVLAAQYESYVLPFIILLAVPLAVLGALSAQGLRGLANDVYCQIGMVMLIGLAAKNSILIVEFAEQLRERGLSIVEAAIESSRIRLRPILMTSLTLILAVLPLVFATGAGSAGRHSVGTTLFGGMIFATFLNVIFIPVLYVVVRTLVPGRAEARSAALDASGGSLHGAPGA